MANSRAELETKLSARVAIVENGGEVQLLRLSKLNAHRRRQAGAEHPLVLILRIIDDSHHFKAARKIDFRSDEHNFTWHLHAASAWQNHLHVDGLINHIARVI